MTLKCHSPGNFQYIVNFWTSEFPVHLKFDVITTQTTSSSVHLYDYDTTTADQVILKTWQASPVDNAVRVRSRVAEINLNTYTLYSGNGGKHLLKIILINSNIFSFYIHGKMSDDR